MIWLRAWLETRPRVFWCLTLFLPLIVTQMVSGPEFVRKAAEDPSRVNGSIFALAGVALAPGAPGYADAMWMNLYLLTAALISLCFGVMLTGSGVCTQSATGLRQGSHASMYFTLSLPVKRRDWVLARAAMGAIPLAAFIVLALAIPPLTAPVTHIAANVRQLAVMLPFLFAGSMAVYAMSILLSIFLDELWQGMLSLIVVSFFIGFGFSSSRWINGNLLRIMCGGDYASTGNLPWAGFAACLLATAVFLAAAVYSAERKEY